MSAPSTTTAVPSTTAAPTLDITPFVGNWQGHGRVLTIGARGIGHIAYRVYKFCTEDPTPPCDEMQGNEIIDGGRIAFRLSSSYRAGTATIAQGTELSSSDPTYPPGPMTARVNDNILTLSIFTQAPFCNDHTSPNYHGCGA